MAVLPSLNAGTLWVNNNDIVLARGPDNEENALARYLIKCNRDGGSYFTPPVLVYVLRQAGLVNAIITHTFAGVQFAVWLGRCFYFIVVSPIKYKQYIRPEAESAWGQPF